MFGIGVIIGAGIFTLTGTAAKLSRRSGGGVLFVIAAICCGLAALCYAEFRLHRAVSGSAYTFSYATLGELIAWIIGWDLILELMLGASVVAQGWSEYFVKVLDSAGSPGRSRSGRRPRRAGVTSTWRRSCSSRC